ncbi:MAG: hemolysin III family protein [Desulfuromusa sp.]|jgi:hemolysin III|nr:hemolysin III family protein [Desulfuromusa sp.]
MGEDYHLVSYSESEERANRLTHGFATLLSLLGSIILIIAASRTDDPYRIVSCAIYSSILCLFYFISTLYHSVRDHQVRYVFRILDHAGIYVVIAGTYTPITLISLRAGHGWALFGTVWGLAVVGVIFKSFMTHKLAILAPVFYIALGWLIVVDVKELLALIPFAGVVWLIAGGLSYTFGIVFYALERIPFNHAIWHLFVIAGSLCHYLAILWYVVPLA